MNKLKKHAICIQCHKNPILINETISLFPENKFDIFIHVDRKSSIKPEINKKANVFFVNDENRIDVRWGQFSQVKATLAIFSLFNPEDYKYIHLISGEDVPAISPDKLFDILKDDDREFIQSELMPIDDGRWGLQDRYYVDYPLWMIKQPKYLFIRVVRNIYREFVLRTGIGKKKVFPFNSFYFGSSWFSITGQCLKWIMEYIDSHKEELFSFFNNATCSDEVFFSTIVRFSPFEDKITNRPARYIVWGEQLSEPKILDETDIPKIKTSNAFFARKVNSRDVLKKVLSK